VLLASILALLPFFYTFVDQEEPFWWYISANPKYIMMSQIASGIFVLLLFIQIFRIWESNDHTHCHAGCEHDHHSSAGVGKRISFFILFFRCWLDRVPAGRTWCFPSEEKRNRPPLSAGKPTTRLCICLWSLFQTIATVFVASFFGIVFMELSFHIVLFALSIVYSVTLFIRQHRLLMMQDVFSIEREGKERDKSEFIQ
jgi:hypothetical protein